MPHVTVTTGARLHFGLLSVNPERARQFGGVGMMVDEPGVRICVSAAAADEIIANCETTVARIENFRERCRLAGLGIQSVRIEVTDSIPGHCGFGSGTQTGLALARALASLDDSFDREQISVEQLACVIDRGNRSAIGIHGFRDGGFLVDGGRRKSAESIGELVARVAWPDEWRVVLIAPRHSIGLHGDAERAAFRQMDPMPESLTQQLCATALMEILPALNAGEFDDFCEGLDAFGNAVGDFFAPSQGGRYGDSSTRELVGDLRSAGFSGIVQSSWGPTLCAMSLNSESAQSVVQCVEQHPREFSAKIVRGLNSGARVQIQDEAHIV